MRTEFTTGESLSVSSPVAQWLDTREVHAEDGIVLIPDRELLLTSMYARSGVDLVINTPGGIKYVVKGFFLNDNLPTLSDGANTHIPGELAKQFAGSIAPEQYAQAAGATAGPVIGVVRSMNGDVRVIRASDGSEVVLKIGDALYQDDIVETGAGGNVGLVFIDGTTLALGEDGELVLDELVYDPSQAVGKGTLRLVSGAAEFVSGGIAKSGADAMTFQTPVATIGIRGTRVFASYDPQTGDITVLNRPTGTDVAGNQTAGIITLTLPNGTVIGDATLSNQGWQWNPVVGTQPTPVTLTEQQVQNIAGAVLDTVNNLQTQISLQPNIIPTPQGGGTNTPTGGPAGPGGPGDGGAGGTGPGAGDGGGAPTTTPPPQVTQTPGINTGNVAANLGGGGNLNGTPQGAGDTTGAGGATGTGTINTNGQGGTNTNPVITQQTNTNPNQQQPPPQVLPQPVLFSIEGGSADDIEAGTITFTVTRSGNLGVAASVNYVTGSGTAGAGTDFIANAGTVSFAPGEISKTISISVLANPGIVEQTETFTVSLNGGSAAAGTPATIATGSATGTIIADPPLPSLVIGDASVIDAVTGSVVLTVTRTGSLVVPSTVGFRTVAGSASSGTDFVAATGSISFAAGQATAQVTIGIVGDTATTSGEPAETFQVELFDAVGAIIAAAGGTATVTIGADPLATFSVAGATVVEGGTASVIVTRGGDLSRPVSVGYATQNGSATAGSDFVAANGVVTFAAGQTAATITVATVLDNTQEAAESFSVVLSNPVGGTISQGVATVSVSADPPLPTLSISGGSGADAVAGTAVFTVTMSAARTLPVTVNYTTVSGSAGAGSDFTAVSGTLTIPAGQTSAAISVPVHADSGGEPDESFSVVLSAPSGATIASGSASFTIVADPITIPSLTITDVTVSDATPGNAVFQVNLSSASSSTVTVQYTTSAISADSSDFTPTSGTLTFSPGVVQHTITVPILANASGESAETFSVVLSNAVGATIADSLGVGTIAADTAATGSPPTISGVTSSNPYMQFDGSDDYLVSDYPTTLESHTIETWVRSAEDAAIQFLAGVGIGAGDGARLYLDGGEVLVEVSFGGSQKVVQSSVTVADGEWHHVAYSYDALTDTLTLYIDGVADTAAVPVVNDPISTFSVNDHVHVGGDGDSSFLRGDMDDVRIWNVVRSAAEIQGHVKAQVPHSASGLQANYTFENYDDGRVGNLGAGGGTDLDLYVSGGSAPVVGAAAVLNMQGGLHATAAGLTSLSGSFTIAALINIDAIGEILPITSKNLSSDEYSAEFKFFVDELGRLKLRMGDDDSSTGANVVGSATLEPGAWYHVAAVYDHDNSSMVLYINGAYDNNTYFNPADRQVSAAPLVIGHTILDGNNEYFDGRIRSLHVWDRGLNSTEIADIRGAGGVVSDPAGLVAAYLFTEGGGTLLHDSSGNGFNAAVTGGTPSWQIDVPPISGSPTLATAEDTPLSFFVNAHDGDGDTLSYSLFAAPSHGDVTLSGLGGVMYVPDADFNGADSFTVRVSDGNGNHVDQVVTVNVSPVNDRPTLTASTPFVVDEGDADPEGHAISDLFAGKFSDPDAGDGFLGVVVVGDLSDDQNEGVYQYYDSNSQSWQNISSVDDVDNGILLSINAQVRFVPVSGFSGTPGALLVRPLDNIFNGHGEFSPPYSDNSFGYGVVRVYDVSGYTVLLGDAVSLGAMVNAATPTTWDDEAEDGLWTTASNWDSDIVPTGTNPVVIVAAGAVLLDNQDTTYIANLTLQAASHLTLGDEADGVSTILDVANAVTLNGGSTLILLGGSDSGGALSIGGALTNAGSIESGGATNLFTLNVGADLTNAAGQIYLRDGTLTIAEALANDGGLTFEGTHTVSAYDIVNESASAGIGYILLDADGADVDVTFQNYNTFENAGLIRLTGTGTHGATLTFTSGGNVHNMFGGGIIQVDGAGGATGARVINADTGLFNRGDDTTPGLIDIDIDAKLTGSVWNGGRIDVASGVTLTFSDGTLNMKHSDFGQGSRTGTLEGAGTIHFNDIGATDFTRFQTPGNFTLSASGPTLRFGTLEGNPSNYGARWLAEGLVTIDSTINVENLLVDGSNAQFVLNGEMNLVGGTPIGSNNLHTYLSVSSNSNNVVGFHIEDTGTLNLDAGDIGVPGDPDDDQTVDADIWYDFVNDGTINMSSDGARVWLYNSGSYNSGNPSDPSNHAFTNNGALNVTGSAEAYIGSSNLVNTASGTITVAADTHFFGRVFNFGDIVLHGGKTLFLDANTDFVFESGSSLTYAGTGIATLALQGGASSNLDESYLTFKDSFTLTDDMKFVIGESGTAYNYVSSMYGDSAAALTVEGVLEIQHGSVTFDTIVVKSGGVIQAMNSVSASVGGDITFESGSRADAAETGANPLSFSGGPITIESGAELLAEDNDDNGRDTGISFLAETNNSGEVTLLRSGGSTDDVVLTISDYTFTNLSGGIVDVGSNRVEIYGFPASPGILRNQAGGTLALASGGSVDITLGTLELNAAQILPTGFTLNLGNTTFYDNFGVNYKGTLAGSGLVTNQGDINLNGSTVTAQLINAGTITAHRNSTLDLGTNTFTNNGVFTINASTTLNVQGTAGPLLLGDFYNAVGAELHVDGTLNMNGLNLYNDGTLTGHVNIFMGGGTYTLGLGTDDSGASPGSLYLDGDAVYKLGSRTNVELGGTQDGAYDVRTITGRFVAGGTLAVLPWLSFAAAAGDSFDVFTWGSREGMFHEASGLTQFDGVALDTVFTETGLTLHARAITHEGAGDLFGTAGDDVLVGRDAGAVLDGGDGDDLILGGEGGNTFIGGAGADRLIGGLGADTADYSADAGAVRADLAAGAATGGFTGLDTLISIENLIGSDYDDILIGNEKDNILVGGLGADTLTGGAGADTFVLRGPEEGGDAITDFTSGEDRIVLEDFGLDVVTEGENFSVIAGSFDGSGAGTNAAFATGGAALIYSIADSTLYYDPNGAAAGYSVIATVPGAVLTAGDIQIYSPAA